MDDSIKLRLYVTAIAIVMAILYLGSEMVNEHYQSFQSEVFENCMRNSPSSDFHESCLFERNSASLPIWKYLLPYLPAVGLLWFNWLLKPNLKLSAESYPNRTIKVLLWLGLLPATFIISSFFWYVMSFDHEEINKVNVPAVLSLTRCVAGLLIAPLLFHHLVAPASLVASMRKGEIALLFLASLLVVACVIFVVRMLLRVMGE